MRTINKKGTIISLKLRDDLYTIGMNLRSPAFLIFNVKSADGKWHKNSLDGIKPLFRVFASTKLVLNHLGVEKLDINYDQSIIDAFEDYKWIAP